VKVNPALKVGPWVCSPCRTLALPDFGTKVMEFRIRNQRSNVLVPDDYILGIAHPTAMKFVAQLK
jgi:hypothetical protein